MLSTVPERGVLAHVLADSIRQQMCHGIIKGTCPAFSSGDPGRGDNTVGEVGRVGAAYVRLAMSGLSQWLLLSWPLRCG
ncbi:hypothetical protein [Austwickia sp. TVS 96-490-7B]|uniref:hypothetical protein n=1 Tax=Austwickia sp. TVS 96-490-7B TaxID=2830843 RepID=UPI001C59674B|nr:hypothetical protein [Austwickia sp. TVS 96-490-7B]